MTPLTLKRRHELRQKLKNTRRQLPQKRREEAQANALKTLQATLPHTGIILSYSSFSHELNTTFLNNWLAKENRLALPRVMGNNLQVLRIKNPLTQQRLSPWGIPEPIPKLCQELSPHAIKAVLVPALGFDRNLHRIGYGKGYYDRFLEQIPLTPAYGLGFKEQLIPGDLPIAPHDLQLSGLYLF